MTNLFTPALCAEAIGIMNVERSIVLEAVHSHDRDRNLRNNAPAHA